MKETQRKEKLTKTWYDRDAPLDENLLHLRRHCAVEVEDLFRRSGKRVVVVVSVVVIDDVSV